jgi:hypothetical protein
MFISQQHIQVCESSLLFLTLDSGKEGLFLYANSSRSLRESDCRRRVYVLVVLGFLMVVANPSESHSFMLVLPSVLHIDKKLGKMWKTWADMDAAWPFLRAHYPLPYQSLQQAITHNLESRPRLASRILFEIWSALREKVCGVAMSVAQLERIWREGSKYKVKVTSQ